MSKANPEYRPLRLPDLEQGPLRRRLLTLFRPAIERVLHFETLNDVYEDAALATADDLICERLLERLGVRFSVTDEELERIAGPGPLILVANHPFGGIEGLILGALVRRARPDVKIMANQLLGVLPKLREAFILVDPFDRPESAVANAAGLKEAIRWVRDGHALGVFPAGEVSHLRLSQRGIVDPAWSTTIARIARRTGASVLPVFFGGANSIAFQFLGKVHPRLRTVMLPSELVKKQGIEVRLAVGQRIGPERLTRFGSAEELTEYLRLRTYLLRGRLRATGHGAWRPWRLRRGRSGPQPIMPAVDPALIEAEIDALPTASILHESGPHRVICAPASLVPSALREIGRLRELTFRAVGEGTGRSMDLDEFDQHYEHLFVWNARRREIIGAYRVGATDRVVQTADGARPGRAVDRLYTASLFKFRPKLLARLDPALELGRAFVRIEQQRDYAPLMLLWRGIARYASMRPRYRYLFGPVSVSNDFHVEAKQLIVRFLLSNHSAPGLRAQIRPRKGYRLRRLPGCDPAWAARVFADIGELDDIIQDIERDGRRLPVLIRQYLRLNAVLLGFNVDPDFGNSLDALMLVDLTRVDRRVLDHFMIRRENAQAYLDHHAAIGEPSLLDDVGMDEDDEDAGEGDSIETDRRHDRLGLGSGELRAETP